MKKGNNISSLQAQNQIAQVQQSILHLQHAIQQAQSHPNQEILEQIKHSLERAERSMAQADNTTDDQGALDLVRRDLEQQRQAYQAINEQT
ncbi:hypothetical protein [Gracilibacillus kekensis]|uniref:Uncharacterized protein n=1 Tax=Gracilibacillus kekensis TaxID=1027249 RepID=A0A1M7JLP9_9BACI|nr:hypothetical protein [Gracilibacillus kekensis]SHM53944.1 hypothetical protein SAMN05216179_0408 [Gracilibacillus kekensis]